MSMNSYLLDCCFVCRSEFFARNIAGFQSERRQSSEPFVTTNSYRSIQSMDMGTRYGHEQWVRGFCQRDGKFEPEIGALANSPDSMVRRVAAGRGVFVSRKVG